MPIKVTCSNCGGVLHAPDDAGGKRGRCPTCGNILPIPAAAQATANELPVATPASPGDRPPSFADFAVSPQVGPPPGGSAEAPRAASRASVPYQSSEADPSPPKRAKPPAEPVDGRRASDPFARTGKPVPGAGSPRESSPSEGTVKSWKRCRGGLGWIQAANFLLFIPIVLLPAYYITQLVKPDLIPNPPQDLFGIEGLSLSFAIPLFTVGGAVVLALLLNVLGRLGVAGAPKRSAVGGPAMLSALAALTALGGAIAVIFPNVAMVLTGSGPFPVNNEPLFAWNSTEGLIQRLGIFIGLSALVVGEFWFASAVGRIGSALADGKTAARSTRYMMLLGLVVIGFVGTGAIAPGPQFGMWAPSYETRVENEEFPIYLGREPQAGNPPHELGKETNELVAGQWEKHVGPQFEKAGEYKAYIAPGLCLLIGLIVWLMYLRMVGAGRRAIKGWLDAHDTSA